MRIHTIVGICLLAATLPQARCTAATRITGSVKQWFDGKTSNHVFELSVAGPRYQLKTIDPMDKGGTLHISGSDGLDTYHLKRALKDGRSVEFGFVTAGVFPEKHYSLGQLIWLTFASSAYLDTDSSHALINQMHGFKMNAEIHGSVEAEVLSRTSAGLPNEIIWKGPKEAPTIMGVRPDHYESDVTTARYAVKSINITTPEHWPSIFYFERYFPPHAKPVNSHGQDKAPFLAEWFEGRIASIEQIDNEGLNFLPVIIASSVGVVDERFQTRPNGEAIHYRIVDHTWKSRENPDVQSSLASITDNSNLHQ